MDKSFHRPTINNTPLSNDAQAAEGGLELLASRDQTPSDHLVSNTTDIASTNSLRKNYFRIS